MVGHPIWVGSAAGEPQVKIEWDSGPDDDFLFIDGDHTGVGRDYEMYRDLVRPGGLIAFHDIVADQPVEGNQVHRF